MSRESREKKLRKVFRKYLTKGVTWSREKVAEENGCRIEDVQRLIDEAGPSKVLETTYFSRHRYFSRRQFTGQLDAVRNI